MRTRSLIALLLVVTAVVLTGQPALALGSFELKENDYNADGRSDLLALHGTEQCLYRWNGNTSGLVGGGTKVGCGWGNFSNQPIAAVGDSNGDGYGDIAAISIADHCLYRWGGTGGGHFGTATRLGCSGWTPFALLFGAGDINNDGRDDLGGIRGDNHCIYFWPGTAQGGFTGQGGAGEVCWAHATPGAIGFTGVGDISGDGLPDIAFANNSDHCLYALLGAGNGTLDNRLWSIQCNQPYTILHMSGMGDLNGDNNGDLLALVSTPSGVAINKWNGTGDGRLMVGADVFGTPSWTPFRLLP